jgi:hypothetical protein
VSRSSLTLQALFEHSSLPGAPYLLASFIACWALLHCYELPPEPDTLLSIDLLGKSHFNAGLREDLKPLLTASLDSDEGRANEEDEGGDPRSHNHR